MNGHRDSFLAVMTSSSRRSRDETGGCDVTVIAKHQLQESRKPEDYRLVRRRPSYQIGRFSSQKSPSSIIKGLFCSLTMLS